MTTRRSAAQAAQQNQQPANGGWNANMFSNFMDNMHQHQQQQQRQHSNTGGVPPPGAGASAHDMRAHAAALEEQRRREQEEERRQRGPPPASRLALKNIPEVKIAAMDLAEETNRSCSVCLEEHELGEKAVKLPCAHIFHRECVWEWLELHCTCPVCRFELETEDSAYERERRVRMQGRRPRYRLQELEGLSIPQIRNLARGQNVDIARCLEKADIVRCLLNSGMIEVVESETPTYDAEDLSRMGVRQLRSLMLQAGIGDEGCLEKHDLLESIMSSRLVTITHDGGDGAETTAQASPPPPPPPPPPSTTTMPPPPPPRTYHGGGEGGGGGGGVGGSRVDGARFTATTGTGSEAPAGGGREEEGEGSRATRRGEQEDGRGTEEGSSATRTGRRSGWWWGGSRNRGSNSGGTSAGTATAAAAAAPPRAVPTRAPAAAADPLDSMSVKELREITNRLGVSTTGCIEKRDMVERIRGSGRYHEARGAGRA